MYTQVFSSVSSVRCSLFLSWPGPSKKKHQTNQTEHKMNDEPHLPFFTLNFESFTVFFVVLMTCSDLQHCIYSVDNYISILYCLQKKYIYILYINDNDIYIYNIYIIYINNIYIYL